MATLSYTLYNYANVPADLVPVDPTVATSDATFVISTNGHFPNPWYQDENGDWQHPDIDGSLRVSIDGIEIGELYWGPPDDDGGGYFVDSSSGLAYGTAIIPRDVWREIISDGQLQITYTIGADAESRATASDYIRADVDWLEFYNGVRGSPEGDTIVVDMPTIIEGRGGNDDITGSGFGDIIMGGIGDDLIDGGGGQDAIRGDDGDDHIDAGDGDDVVLGGNSADEISGGLGADRLRGSAGNDFVAGGDGDDVLWGDDGDDELTGGRSNNHLFGGVGADSFVFSAANGPETQHVYDFDRSAGDQLVYLQDFDEVIDAIDIRVGKDGSVVTIFDLQIVVSGAFDLTSDDIVFRPIPEPFPSAPAALAVAAYQMVVGTDDVDNIDLWEAPGPASIHGLGGDDYITGTLFGDQILAGEGRDLVFGGDGDDRIDGGGGNDELSGGDGDDRVLGGGGHNILYGDNGNDRLWGGEFGNNLIGGNGDDFLWGGADLDNLWGDDGTDRLWGGGGNDDLDGGWGNDYIRGGDGDDRVWGNRGNNHLWGGDGADTFMFNYGDEVGTQRVYDFDRTEGDKLIYYQYSPQPVDGYDIRVGKDGSVITVGDTTIVVSGVFDLTTADFVLTTDADWPWWG